MSTGGGSPWLPVVTEKAGELVGFSALPTLADFATSAEG
jgi:hypothetical protein